MYYLSVVIFYVYQPIQIFADMSLFIINKEVAFTRMIVIGFGSTRFIRVFDSLSVSDIESVVPRERQLTFLASFILVISNAEIIQGKRWRSKSSFCGAYWRWTKHPKKDQKTDGTSLISIFSTRVWVNIFWCTVLEITVTPSTDFVIAKKHRNYGGRMRTRRTT